MVQSFKEIASKELLPNMMCFTQHNIDSYFFWSKTVTFDIAKTGFVQTIQIK